MGWTLGIAHGTLYGILHRPSLPMVQYWDGMGTRDSTWDSVGYLMPSRPVPWYNGMQWTICWQSWTCVSKILLPTILRDLGREGLAC